MNVSLLVDLVDIHFSEDGVVSILTMDDGGGVATLITDDGDGVDILISNIKKEDVYHLLFLLR